MALGKDGVSQEKGRKREKMWRKWHRGCLWAAFQRPGVITFPVHENTTSAR